MPMQHSENHHVISILKKLPFFSGLYPDEYEHIRTICEPCHYPNEQTIFNEGDGSPCLYVLLSGKVFLNTKNSGQIYTLYPGDIFGEIGLITQNKRTATATCEADSSLFRIDSDKFNLIFGKFPRISAILMRNITIGLANHISRMNNHEVVDYIPPQK